MERRTMEMMNKMNRRRPQGSRRRASYHVSALTTALLVFFWTSAETTTAFLTTRGPTAFLSPPSFSFSSQSTSATTTFPSSITTATTTALFAKKKKKASPASAALDALDLLDDLADEPLSKKEQKQLAKQQAKQAKKEQQQNQQQQQSASNNEASVETASASAPAAESTEAAAPQKKLSKKEQMLAKALALEALDEAAAAASAAPAFDDDDATPKMSKKEAKKAAKLAEKQAAKAEAKAAKKAAAKQAAVAAEEEGTDDDSDATADEPVVNGGDDDVNDADDDSTPEQQQQQEEESQQQQPAAPATTKITLEDKIRKERPPPRIRVMESSQPGYTSLRLEGIGITFRNQQVLKDVTWGVQTGDRIGLVGANGAGKTTMLRILAGELEPTTGDVIKSSQDLRVAVLRQEFVDELVPTRTLREEMMSVFGAENQILQELKEAEAELEKNDGSDPDAMQEILDRMQELQNKAEDKEVYLLESRVKKVLDVMGFTDDEADDLVASFSGGWKMRIGLGKVLLQDPNVLLLDEPTNHLDLDSVFWLESFLREQQQIPMVIVSHDREFLDQVCTKIVDAEGGLCTEYDGNYSRFLQLKKARMDSWQAAYAAQEKKIKEERQWINKFRTKQPQAVKQRQAKLDKLIKSKDYVQKPPFTGKPFRFRFPDAPRLSPEVAEVKHMSHAYRSETSQNRLFDDVNLFIEKGDRIAILGPNGSGKSTLLRLMTGKETPDEGSAALIGQNVVMSYFEQNQADALDLDKTVIETIQGASSGQSYNELRALLGQFLFKGDSVEKKVRYLSGGEKARLSLCCMMLTPANLLILDEPTNHLDIPAKEMLEEALQHFTGSVMIVTHDRYFISKVATTIVAVEDKKLVKYQGDYKAYMDRVAQVKEKVEARYVSGVARIDSAPIIDVEAIQAGDKKKKSFGGNKNAGMVTRKNKGVKNAKRMEAK